MASQLPIRVLAFHIPDLVWHLMRRAMPRPSAALLIFLVAAVGISGSLGIKMGAFSLKLKVDASAAILLANQSLGALGSVKGIRTVPDLSSLYWPFCQYSLRDSSGNIVLDILTTAESNAVVKVTYPVGGPHFSPDKADSFAGEPPLTIQTRHRMLLVAALEPLERLRAVAVIGHTAPLGELQNDDEVLLDDQRARHFAEAAKSYVDEQRKTRQLGAIRVEPTTFGHSYHFVEGCCTYEMFGLGPGTPYPGNVGTWAGLVKNGRSVFGPIQKLMLRRVLARISNRLFQQDHPEFRALLEELESYHGSDKLTYRKSTRPSRQLATALRRARNVVILGLYER